MSAEPVLSHYQAQYRALAPELPGRELAWLVSRRQGALARLLREGWPSNRHEAWKYAPLRLLTGREFHPVITRPPVAPQALAAAALPALTGPRLVFVNGRYDAGLSAPDAAEAGVSVQPLAEALAEAPERIAELLEADPGADAEAFGALNTAFMADGACIRVAAGVQARQPISLVFLTAPAPVRQMICPRVLLDLEAGAGAQVVVHHAGIGGTGERSHLVDLLVQGALAEGAELSLLRLQEEDDQALSLAQLRLRQGAASRCTAADYALGGRFARTELTAELAGVDAAATVTGMLLPQHRQHMELLTTMDHAAPATLSTQQVKAVADGHGRGVFNGLVRVRPDAQRIDARQNSANLLLSPSAEIDARPQLEIYADDVRCTHGATVGQLDESALFYLRTRGLPLAAARSLLIYAFLAELLPSALPALGERVDARLRGELPVPEGLA